MKRSLLLLLTLIASAGCLTISEKYDEVRFGENPYEEPPFYARYLNTGSRLDAEIQSYLVALRETPDSAALHNELGALLLKKGFPNDAEREFLRALHSDPDFYPAWYNLGLLRAARGNQAGALRALKRTVDLKPGHAAALFQIGLMHEQNGRNERAVDFYAKAFRINPSLLDARVNPQILDSEIVELALIRLYPDEHTRRAMQLQPTPAGWEQAETDRELAPSPQPEASEIVPPAPPITDPPTPAPPPPGR